MSWGFSFRFLRSCIFADAAGVARFGCCRAGARERGERERGRGSSSSSRRRRSFPSCSRGKTKTPARAVDGTKGPSSLPAPACLPLSLPFRFFVFSLSRSLLFASLRSRFLSLLACACVTSQRAAAGRLSNESRAQKAILRDLCRCFQTTPANRRRKKGGKKNPAPFSPLKKTRLRPFPSRSSAAQVKNAGPSRRAREEREGKGTGTARKSEIFFSLFLSIFFFSTRASAPCSRSLFACFSRCARFTRRAKMTYRSHRAAAGGQGWTCTGGRGRKRS